MKIEKFLYKYFFLVIFGYLCFGTLFVKAQNIDNGYYEPVSISPKGRYVLLKNRKGDFFNLAIFDTSKGVRKHVYRSTRNPISIHFSPDEKSLIFQMRNSSNLFELFLLEFSSKKVTQLNVPLSLSGLPPIYWSPDGQVLAYYEVQRDKTQLYLVSVSDLKPPKAIAHGLTLDSVLAWSPKGEELLVYAGVEGGELLRINKEGNVIQRYPQVDRGVVKEIFWGENDQAFMVRLPSQAEFSQLAKLNLVTGLMETIVSEKANVEDVMILKDAHLILFHSAYRGVSVPKIFELESGRTRSMANAEDGSIKVHGWANAGKSLCGIYYGYEKQPQIVHISLDGSVKQVVYEGMSSPQVPIPHSSVIELEVASEFFRAFIWKPAKLAISDKAIIYVHGGPSTFIGPEWNREYANLVSRGWMVVAPNYHGSSSEGGSFLRKNELSIQVSEVIATIRYVRNYVSKDATLYVLGQSYGSRLVIESLKEVGDLVDGVILTSTILGAPLRVPCDKLPPYIASFHGGEDYMNSPESVQTYLKAVFGQDAFSFNLMPEEGHILRRDSSFSKIREAISIELLKNKTRSDCKGN